jgi:hypothetical protein
MATGQPNRTIALNGLEQVLLGKRKEGTKWTRKIAH